ncbi:unnamed protein product [Litomosoides sigmodontis]|uniref:Uncharacterized protein n=1 Tax=Litomosoides sigmodontis TaxID=42156 RepID=A0A3P6TQ94_LITSI|nr:unnamed protein product [Litomosoides sigmodontis]
MKLVVYFIAKNFLQVYHMASSNIGSGRRSNCIVITNPQLINKTTQHSERTLKLYGAEFVINDKQMIAASNFLKRTLVGAKISRNLPHFMFLENDLDKKKVIVLDDLKSKQPCFDSTGLAIAILFANGCVEIPLNRIINALAAASALEMWSMRKAIIDQLCVLAARPESAPFAINVATCSLGKDDAKYIIKQSLDNFDKIIKQRGFLAINERSFEFFISLFLYEFAKNIFDKLRPLCGSDLIDSIEQLIAQNLVEMINDASTQCSEPKVIAPDPATDADKSLKFGKFYKCFRCVEFEAPKELLASNKPKFIGLQLEAILECSD